MASVELHAPEHRATGELLPSRIVTGPSMPPRLFGVGAKGESDGRAVGQFPPLAAEIIETLAGPGHRRR